MEDGRDATPHAPDDSGNRAAQGMVPKRAQVDGGSHQPGRDRAQFEVQGTGLSKEGSVAEPDQREHYEKTKTPTGGDLMNFGKHYDRSYDEMIKQPGLQSLVCGHSDGESRSSLAGEALLWARSRTWQGP